MLYSRSSHGGKKKKEELYLSLFASESWVPTRLSRRSLVACRLRLKPKAVGLGLGEMLLVLVS